MLTLHVGTFCLKLRLLLVKLNLRILYTICRESNENHYQNYFLSQSKEFTESWVNLSEISGEVYCIRDFPKCPFQNHCINS